MTSYVCSWCRLGPHVILFDKSTIGIRRCGLSLPRTQRVQEFLLTRGEISLIALTAEAPGHSRQMDKAETKLWVEETYWIQEILGDSLAFMR